MEKDKTGIHVEKPVAQDSLQKNEIEELQLQYNLSEHDQEEAFKAVGNDKAKLKDYLSLGGSQSTEDIAGNIEPEIAVNSNPAANANIESNVEKLSSEEIELQSQVPNEEITDGEDG